MAAKKNAVGQAKRPRGRGERAGLDLQQIVQAGRSISPDMLSMQSLADALQVDRKALNYHVKDRQTLLGLVAMDAFSSHFAHSDIAAERDWQSACRTYAVGFVEGVLALGELADALWFGEPLTAMALQPTEALFAQLRAAGFEDAAVVRLVTMLASLCLSHVRDLNQALGEADRPRQRSLRAALNGADAAAFDNLNRVAQLGVDTYGREQLDFIIEVFVRGASTLLPPRRRSGKRAPSS